MSSASGFRPSHVLLLARTYVRFSLRTGAGIVFLFLLLTGTLTFAGLLSKLMLMSIEKAPDLMMGIDEEASVAEKFEAAKFLFVSLMQMFNGAVGAELPGAMDAIMTDVNPEQHPETYHLTAENPALISLIYMMLLWFAPLTACLVGFSQTSVDIGNKGLRYLLLRTERPNIFLGRFLGTLGYVAVSMFGASLIICGYFHLVLHAYPGAQVWTWGLQCFLAVLLMVLPYLALTAWISGAMKGGFTSLVACMAACMLPPMLLLYIGGYLKRFGISSDWLQYLLPLGWRDDLLSVHWGTRLSAIAVMLLFTGVFLLLGYRRFSRRDL